MVDYTLRDDAVYTDLVNELGGKVIRLTGNGSSLLDPFIVGHTEHGATS